MCGSNNSEVFSVCRLPIPTYERLIILYHSLFINGIGRVSDAMNLGNVVFYDFEHCREFLEDHAKHLRDNVVGLDVLGLYRDLFSGFANEALTESAITLGQFDHNVTFLFIPEHLRQEYYPEGHEVARAKALELMGCKQAPVVLDLVNSTDVEPPVHEKAHYRSWMPKNLLELLDQRMIEIQMIYNAQPFHDLILTPTLQEQGFSLADNYLASARSGFVRVRHSAVPGKVYKLPLLQWVREMFSGGFSVAYLVAMLGNATQKLSKTVQLASGNH